MKLFKLEIGNVQAFAVAETIEEMEERKAEVDHTFAFLPVDISEVSVPGYTITATPDETSETGVQAPQTTGRGRRKQAAE